MYFSKVTALGIFAISLVSASPIDERATVPTFGTALAQCYSGEVLSCCSTAGGSTTPGGVVGQLENGVGKLVQSLTGGNCQALNIPTNAAVTPFGNACANKVASCCLSNNKGSPLPNIQCKAISV